MPNSNREIHNLRQRIRFITRYYTEPGFCVTESIRKKAWRQKKIAENPNYLAEQAARIKAWRAKFKKKKNRKTAKR